MVPGETNPCALYGGEPPRQMTSHQYVQVCGPKGHYLLYIIEYVHAVLFHPSSREVHEAAIYLNLFLVLCAVNAFESTRWMGSTFAVAFMHMVQTRAREPAVPILR